jgi:hypothetical protein
MLVWGDTNHTEAMLAVQTHCLLSYEPTNPTKLLLQSSAPQPGGARKQPCWLLVQLAAD